MISFIIRVHNEEGRLAASMLSLYDLPPEVPAEIVVILHRCTDDSVSVALSAGLDAPSHIAVHIVADDIPVSRPGLECLITPAESQHSLVSFYNRSFEQATHPWTFKWDADFVATDDLISFLTGELADPRPAAYVIEQRDFDLCGGAEPYLVYRRGPFTKWWFWEVPTWPVITQLRPVSIEEASIWHISRLPELKPYWLDPPWFTDPALVDVWPEAAELAERYRRAIEIVGPEPRGVARSNNPACDEFLFRCQELLDADGQPVTP